MSNRYRTAWTLFLALCLLGGCAVRRPPPFAPHQNSSYTVRGHNYSFAIYNSDYRLLTHPVEDLLAEMKWRKAAKRPAVSDVYLVSHGWDYTLPLAIANYHNYLEMADVFVGQKTAPADFQPYFIFVTWTSTTRPATNLAKAILPFGMDTAAEPLTNLIDKGPLRLLSAWKQSLNAAQTALGAQYPNDYLGRDWKDSPYGYYDINLIRDADAIMGEDVPVSALIYRLIRQQHLQPKGDAATHCEMPDPFDPASDDCVPLTRTRLHLVGHSYGAKLVTLAGMEAIRRWMLENLAAHSQTYSSIASCISNGNETDMLLAALAVCEQTGHRKPFGELKVAFAGLDKPPLLKAWYENARESPIDSLILFNPAFHPSELSYPVDPFHFAPTQTLRFIPRKAIVYARNDYANGAPFALREIILNTQITQMGNQASKKLDQVGYQSSGWMRAPIYLLQTAIGPVDMGYSLAYTSVSQVFYNLINFPWDYWHHVRTGTLGGLYRPIAGSGFEWNTLPKGLANTIDFFLPTNMLFRNESEQGLFRLNKPGLGKTGLDHLAAGRLAGANLWGLEDYYSATEPFGKVPCSNEPVFGNCRNESAAYADANAHPFAPDIGPGTFSRFTREPLVGGRGDYAQDESLRLREKFYAFDASQVYDSYTPIMGSHGDLRKHERPEGLECASGDEACEKGEKRERTFNFVFNFTQTRFEDELCRLNREGIEPMGIDCNRHGINR